MLLFLFGREERRNQGYSEEDRTNTWPGCCHSPGRGCSEASVPCVMSRWTPRTEWRPVVAQTKEVKAGLDYLGAYVSGKAFNMSSEYCSKSQMFQHYYPWMRSSISLQSGQLCVGCIQPRPLRTCFFSYFFFFKMLAHDTIFGARCCPSCWDWSYIYKEKKKPRTTKFKLRFSSLVS